MMKKGFVMALLLVAIPCVSFGAIIYSEAFTDISSGLDSGLYVLTVGDRDDGVSTTYDASLSVYTNVVANTSIAWFALKLDGGAAGVITASGITASDGSSWEAGDGSVDILNYNNFPINTWTGGYASPITGGFALVDGGAYSWTFDFDLSSALNEAPSLQVGFSAPHGYPRISQSIPEPGTLMILGAGLIGLASLGRKKFGK